MVVSAKALTADVLETFASGASTIRELFPDAPRGMESRYAV